MDSTTTPVQGPATQSELSTLRTTFAALFIGAVLLGGILSRRLTLWAGSIPLSPTSYRVVEFIWLMLWLSPSIAIVELARRVHLPRWPLLIPISVWPLINWIAFALVLGYTPEHLRLVETKSKPGWGWYVLGGLPLALMALLMIISPAYMSQLVLGPPVGATIPLIGIPCGWPLLVAIVVLSGLTDYSLWLGSSRWRIGGFAMTAATLLILALLLFPALWTVLVGPAGVQIFKQFFSGP